MFKQENEYCLGSVFIFLRNTLLAKQRVQQKATIFKDNIFVSTRPVKQIDIPTYCGQRRSHEPLLKLRNYGQLMAARGRPVSFL